jgi:predicted kinase
MKKKNSKILVLQGPPASGKSTFAKEYCAKNENAIIVNRDSIRLMTKGFYDCKNYEDYVSDIEVSCIENGVKHGYVVIIDATNLNPKTINKWKTLAEELNVEIEFKEFYISFKEAVERDIKRGENGGISVGKKVLERFYRSYYKKRFEEEITDKRLITHYNHDIKDDCVICDLDRTIALSTGRNPFDWSRILEDKCDDRMVNILCDFADKGCLIIFLTGRDEEARENTEQWLMKHIPSPHVEWILEMKETENKYEKGYLFKERFYENHIKGNYNVKAVFEDNDDCVKMWRSKGLLTCQVWPDKD